MELGLAIGFAMAFALTNGFHDAANAIATLVATRGARPGAGDRTSADPRRGVGDVRCTLIQPRRKRCTKSMGVIAALLLASGHIHMLGATLDEARLRGNADARHPMGGWRIVRTIGRRIFHLAPIDGLASQSASTAVILAASYAGAPVSTTQVVASSVVGVGAGRRRTRHVRWAVVRSMGFAWLMTLPAAGALGAATLLIWRAIG